MEPEYTQETGLAVTAGEGTANVSPVQHAEHRLSSMIQMVDGACAELVSRVSHVLVPQAPEPDTQKEQLLAMPDATSELVEFLEAETRRLERLHARIVDATQRVTV